MSRGRHRGRSHWGILPLIGKNPEYLWIDIAVIAVRCFGVGILAFGMAGILLMVSEVVDWLEPAIWSACSIAASMFAVGFGVTRYVDTAVRYSKTQQADQWLRAVHGHRIDRLVQREDCLVSSIAELHDQFEKAKAALLETREERIAEERMMAYLLGVQESLGLKAHLANPRNRLRVVPDVNDESA